MNTLKPLTPAQIKGALKATKYPSKHVNSDLTRSLIQLTSEQIKDGKSAEEIASYLGMAAANRLPRGIAAVDFAHEVSHRFLLANTSN